MSALSDVLARPLARVAVSCALCRRRAVATSSSRRSARGDGRPAPPRPPAPAEGGGTLRASAPPASPAWGALAEPPGASTRGAPRSPCPEPDPSASQVPLAADGNPVDYTHATTQAPLEARAALGGLDPKGVDPGPGLCVMPCWEADLDPDPSQDPPLRPRVDAKHSFGPLPARGLGFRSNASGVGSSTFWSRPLPSLARSPPVCSRRSAAARPVACGPSLAGVREGGGGRQLVELVSLRVRFVVRRRVWTSVLSLNGGSRPLFFNSL